MKLVRERKDYLKAVMKSVQKEGHYPLYVRTFKSKIDVSSLCTHYLS